MINRKALMLAVTLAMFLMPPIDCSSGIALAEELAKTPNEEGVALPQGEVDEEGELVTADEYEQAPTVVETHTLVKGFAGYRFLTLDGYGGRAAPYEYLHSSPTGGGMVNSLGKDLKLAVEGVFNNEKDYHADLLYDYGGDYRVHLRSEALFHNLGHEQLFTPAFSLGAGYTPVDKDPLGSYGVKVQQDLAAVRLKFHDYPVHLNLGYWRISRDGTEQLRYADHSFTGGGNTIFANKRTVDLQTHEGQIGLDTHLGFLDIIYSFRIRQFEDRAGIPRDPFVARSDQSAGSQEHNENPDSRFYSHTVKLHTSLAGGIVGAASYSYGKRDNQSRLADIRGVNETSTALHNAAGDFTYTPCKWFSAAMKYRRMETDTTTPATISSSFALQPIIDVRPAVDTQKDSVILTLSIRPIDTLTFKGEYKGEYLHRDQVFNSSSNYLNNWHLPENSATHRGTLTILSQPIKGLRLKALYSYSGTNHPAYGNSFEERHEGQLLATYTSKKKWGAAANYRGSRESNDHIERFTIDSTTPITFSATPLQLSREKQTNNSTVSFWFTPLEKLTFSASYAFLQNSTDQTVLYTGLTPATQGLANYSNHAQVCSISSTYRFNEKFDLSLALQQVRSLAEFDPSLITVNSTSGTSGIKELSRLKTVESSISTKATYQLSKNISCTVDYTYQDYDEKNSSLFDGTAQTVIAHLTAKW